MNSPLLIKLSRKKTGWKPTFIVDTKSKKPRRDACMIGNGKRAKLVEVEEKLEGVELDNALEKLALQTIEALETNDRNILYREVIVFSAIASASIGQAQYFTPLVRQEAKMKMKQFVGDTEKFVNVIQKEAIGFHGEKLESVLDNLEDATHRVFQKFGDAIIAGKLPEFINMVSAFDTKS